MMGNNGRTPTGQRGLGQGKNLRLSNGQSESNQNGRCGQRPANGRGQGQGMGRGKGQGRGLGLGKRNGMCDGTGPCRNNG